VTDLLVFSTAATTRVTCSAPLVSLVAIFANWLRSAFSAMPFDDRCAKDICTSMWETPTAAIDLFSQSRERNAHGEMASRQF
jgi:hypothetical protein